MRISPINYMPLVKKVNSAQNRANLLNFSSQDVFIKNEKTKTGTYETNLSLDELQKRTSKDCLSEIHLLNETSEEYLNLDDSDKIALSYLIKAAREIDEVNLELDSHYNIPFRDFLNEDNSKEAQLTKVLFDAQKGVFSKDFEGNSICLMKNAKPEIGHGYYPNDLKKEEFHQILINMLKKGKKDEVQKILNQRSVVQRNGDELIAIDYTEKFKDCFQKAADYILKASEFQQTLILMNF